MNLLEETKAILKENDKLIFDILWFGTEDFVVDHDIQELFSIEYDNGYGLNEIPAELKVVGDGWWLERGEYDGSEWWEYKELPKKPALTKTNKNLLDLF